MTAVPKGYLGSDARILSGPAPELVTAGYELEMRSAPLLHRGLGLADLAHVVVLYEAGVVDRGTAAKLVAVVSEALDTSPHDFPYDAQFGDAYNSRERFFEDRVGHLAGWLHTGRTRREAGRIAFRLSLRLNLLELHQAVCSFASALADQERRHASTLWADTTYLQPAQPSTFGHYLGSFAEESCRNLARLREAFEWANHSPGGSGGVGGPRTPMDRSHIADLLGFPRASAHTRDGMWATDGLVDACVAATQSATTADRLAEDFEAFASPAFGYITLDASLCRASVLMPQKRNPYALSVIRSGSGVLIGRTAGLMVTQRTPSARTDNWLHAYGEVDESVRLSRDIVRLAAAMVRSVEVDAGMLESHASAGFTGAADLAEELVLSHGLDYRSAYRVVGRVVAAAMDDELDRIDAGALNDAARDLLGISLALDQAAVDQALDPSEIVRTRVVSGGSSPERVIEHAESVYRRVDEQRDWCNETSQAIVAAESRLLEQSKEIH